MKYLDRSAFCRFFVDLVVTDDWKTMLTNVEETEGKIDVVLKIYDKNTLKNIQDGLCHLEGQVEQMLEPLTVSAILFIRYTLLIPIVRKLTRKWTVLNRTAN